MRQITDIAFEPDGTVIIAFIGADDIRCEGAVAVRRQVRIAPSDQYAPDVERLTARANALLNDALEDWSNSEAVPAELLGPLAPGQQRPSEGDPMRQPVSIDLDDDDASAERNMKAIEESRQNGPYRRGQTEPCGNREPHGAHTYDESMSGYKWCGGVDAAEA